MSGLINVTAMPDKLRDIEAFIDTFQASVLRQVMIEAKIVEVTLNKTFEFGIDWRVVGENGKAAFDLRNDPTTQTTGNAGNINFTLTNGSTSITAVLTALASQGAVNVLSNEKTTALNNQRAIFNVTTDEVFFNISRTPLLGPTGGVISLQNQVIPQQISVGVVLDVLPQISADNILTMDIRPAVTSIARVDSISLSDGTSATAPVIARREGDTIARLRAGETMVIGGLVQTKKENTEGGIPLLKDIPLLGWAFKSIKQVENRTELVIFLTPTIVSSAPATGGGR
jgi:MSHA type pilus biogenesis protein MshL